MRGGEERGEEGGEGGGEGRGGEGRGGEGKVKTYICVILYYWFVWTSCNKNHVTLSLSHIHRL